MEQLPPNRRRFRLSLRALLIGLTIFACWQSPLINRARRQREVVAAIKEAGGSVVYDYQRARNGALLPDSQPKTPKRLRAVLGDDLFCDVIEVDLNRAKIDDEWVARLNGLPKLQALNLAGTPISDAGIESLHALAHLKRAALDETAVTDRSLAHLARVSPHLETLSIGGAGITDAGLAEIAKLDQLQTLVLNRAAITDAGMQRLAALHELQMLWIASAPITDRGLAPFISLQKLRRLFLQKLNITDAGVKQLAALGSLQRLAITQAAITDAGLAPLTQLKWLDQLELYDTAVTDAGIAQLAQAMPTCKISTAPR